LTARLEEILTINLADDRLAWTLGSDGRWSKVPTERGFDAQYTFQQLAVGRAAPVGAWSAV
jgi:polyphosphate kinase